MYDIEVLAKEALITLSGDFSYNSAALVKTLLKKIIKISQHSNTPCLACGCLCSDCGCQNIDGYIDQCCSKCGCCIDHALPF